MGVPITGISHAVVRVVRVAVPSVIAGSYPSLLDVVMARVVAAVVAQAPGVTVPEYVVPGSPGPPEHIVIGARPDPVAVMADPNHLLSVVMVVGLPPVGVGPLENTPMRVDMADRVRVVVPVLATAAAQVGVADEVKYTGNFVDQVPLGASR